MPLAPNWLLLISNPDHKTESKGKKINNTTCQGCHSNWRMKFPDFSKRIKKNFQLSSIYEYWRQLMQNEIKNTTETNKCSMLKSFCIKLFVALNLMFNTHSKYKILIIKKKSVFF